VIANGTVSVALLVALLVEKLLVEKLLVAIEKCSTELRCFCDSVADSGAGSG